MPQLPHMQGIKCRRFKKRNVLRHLRLYQIHFLSSSSIGLIFSRCPSPCLPDATYIKNHNSDSLTVRFYSTDLRHTRKAFGLTLKLLLLTQTPSSCEASRNAKFFGACFFQYLVKVAFPGILLKKIYRQLSHDDGVIPCPCKDKAIPLQAWTGPEGSGRLRLPDFKTIHTRRW